MVNSCRDEVSFGMCCDRAQCNTLLTVSGCGSRAFTAYRGVVVENVKILFGPSLDVLAYCFII